MYHTAKSSRQRLSPSPGKPTVVDREHRRILGYVVAQEGVFKSRRGEFDIDSLRRIVNLTNSTPAGLKSRFTHPGLSDDGLGSFLGRSKNARLDKLPSGKFGVRADLYFAAAGSTSPKGDLAGYVLDLAGEDPDALSSSLVLAAEKIVHLDERGRPKHDQNGDQLPPLWIPTKLYASDIVDTGDAVDGLLSAQPLSGLWQASRALDTATAGWPADRTSRFLASLIRGLLSGTRPDDVSEMDYQRGREIVSSVLGGRLASEADVRVPAFAQRYLENRYGTSAATSISPVRRKLNRMLVRTLEPAK